MGKYITDTEALICFLDSSKDSDLGSTARKAFEEAYEGKGLIYIPSVVFVELFERGYSQSAIQTFSLIETNSENYKIVPLNEQVAMAVSRISDLVVPNIYGRIITATALVKKVPLLTQREEILRYGKVEVMWNEEVSKLSNEQERPTIGIITALPKEYAACLLMLGNLRKYIAEGGRSRQIYQLGEIPALGGGVHKIVLPLPTGMGTNAAAASTTQLLGDFPTVDCVINVGIAGGIPHPEKPEEHVRLGDIVVLGAPGIIQYDFIKETVDEIIPSYPPRPPVVRLLRGAWMLEAEGKEPWLPFIIAASSKSSIKRPDEAVDVLVASNNPQLILPHPVDPKRKIGHPRVFIGPIASSNTLLKDPFKRDYLRDRDGIKAVEMEGSGVAEATWQSETGYFVVRGICDYCDSTKGDLWQEYASIVAAAYTRALLEAVAYQ